MADVAMVHVTVRGKGVAERVLRLAARIAPHSGARVTIKADA